VGRAESRGSHADAEESESMTAMPVLLVEDDALVREVLHAVLADAGFEVFAASSGAQALAELDTDAERFKAVITDINLALGSDGWSVGNRARERVAGMPVIYMSANRGNEWASNGVPNSAMIAKPFEAAHLIDAILRLIGEPDGSRAGSSPA
jgi:DNA-binding response OmpR family regulator